MPEQPPVTSFSDVADVVSVKTNDLLPMVVGGHAVNIWALAYGSRLGPELRLYAPFTTKDLDLWGSKEILQSLADKYKVPITLSPPRSPGIGYVVIPKGSLQLKVELLTGVNGIRRIEEQNGVQLDILGTKVRVLDAISCLKAKIANAVEIDQAHRQDVKHVKIMKLCAHEFAKDVIAQGNRGQLNERLVINYIEDLRGTITGPKADMMNRKWNVTLDEVMPKEAIQQSTMEKVKNFAKFRLAQRQQKSDGPKRSL